MVADARFGRAAAAWPPALEQNTLLTTLTRTPQCTVPPAVIHIAAQTSLGLRVSFLIALVDARVARRGDTVEQELVGSKCCGVVWLTINEHFMILRRNKFHPVRVSILPCNYPVVKKKKVAPIRTGTYISTT